MNQGFGYDSVSGCPVQNKRSESLSYYGGLPSSPPENCEKLKHFWYTFSTILADKVYASIRLEK